MKLITTFIALAVCCLSMAQTAIPVHLAPAKDSPQIGQLEALSLAVSAEWPANVAAIDGWHPVYYRGTFEVYVDNNDVAKDLTAKPGSSYYLTPNTAGPRLSIATEKDKVDILSVDTWFCKMQLETILVAYIADTGVDASSIVTSLPKPPKSVAIGTSAIADAVKQFQGRLEKTGMIGKNRSGLDHKLVRDGKTLAFVDLSQLPSRIHVQDYMGIYVEITGTLSQEAESSTLTLVARTLKKAAQ